MDTVALDRDDGARVARSIVASECEDADTGAQCTDSAVLLTSELVTNALKHGCGSVSLTVDAGKLRVRVEVSDDEPTSPRLIDADPDAESGRGMFIVDALASSWGIEEQPDGKVVWFELPAQP